MSAKPNAQNVSRTLQKRRGVGFSEVMNLRFRSHIHKSRDPYPSGRRVICTQAGTQKFASELSGNFNLNICFLVYTDQLQKRAYRLCL